LEERSVKLDLIIPTMWRIDEFSDTLSRYSKSPFVGKIVVIDNDRALRPKINLPKVEFACFGLNIFVNPAWNEGYWRSSSEIIGILNDDIFVPDSVFERVLSLDFQDVGILGFNTRATDQPFLMEKIDFNRSKPIGGQCFGFGVCMFLPRKNYRVIPSLYEVWFGDDYLCHNVKSVYRFESSLVTGQISGTINSEKRVPHLQERIDSDTANAHRYLLKDGP
jgi:hypothetical protein